MRHLPLCVGLTLLTACATSAPFPEPRTGARPTWAAFLSGADLRGACGEGRPDKYRVVLRGPAVPGSTDRPVLKVLEARGTVGEGGQLEAFVLPAEPSGNPEAPLPPRHDRSNTMTLNGEQFAALADRLTEVGPPPMTGSPLDDSGIAWIASGCRDGHWFLGTGRRPMRIGQAAFPGLSRGPEPGDRSRGRPEGASPTP